MNYAEADRILTLYTPYHGKLRAIAKGVRRAKSRSAGHLDLFNRSELLVAQGRNLGVVSQPQMLERLDGLRNDLAATGFAHYVCELLDAFMPDGLANTALYGALTTTLQRLASAPSPLTVRAFELILLDAAGYRPELHHCLGCGRPVVPGENRFSVALGGIICPDCASEDHAAKPVTDHALKLLRNLQTNPEQILRLQSVDARLAREIESRLGEYIAYRLERRPKSVAVIERIETRLAGFG